MLGTWLVDWDRRLRMTRQFQLQRPADGVTLLRARTTFVCIELSSGKPRRMPPEFLAGYGQALPRRGPLSMEIALAPMEGLVDDILRELLTEVGGLDWCVSEFIRVCDRLLPAAAFAKLAPELEEGARTPSGTPMRVQLLGSDPACLADTRPRLHPGRAGDRSQLRLPAKTVNKSRGGAVLLKEPELLNRIVESVRQAVPAHIPVTAKMRLGYDSPNGALACVRGAGGGGAAQLVVHARTKVEGYSSAGALGVGGAGG